MHTRSFYLLLLLICCVSLHSTAQESSTNAKPLRTWEITVGASRPFGSGSYVKAYVSPTATFRYWVSGIPNGKAGLLFGLDYDTFNGQFRFSNPRTQGGEYLSKYVGATMGIRQHIGRHNQFFLDAGGTLTGKLETITDAEQTSTASLTNPRGTSPGLIPAVNAGLRTGVGARIPAGKIRLIGKFDICRFASRLDNQDSFVNYMRFTLGIGI